MGKKIKNKDIKNHESEEELAMLFLYELLANIESEIIPEKIILFFATKYDYDISDYKIKHVEVIMKNLLRHYRTTHLGEKLSKNGYESHEF